MSTLRNQVTFIDGDPKDHPDYSPATHAYISMRTLRRIQVVATVVALYLEWVGISVAMDTLGPWIGYVGLGALVITAAVIAYAHWVIPAQVARKYAKR